MKRRDPAVSAERTALAQAIQAVLDAKRGRDALLHTETPAQRAVKAAEDAVEDATERLRIAKSSAADEATDRMLDGDVVELPASLRTARATLAEAEDRLDLARATRDRLNSRRTDIDNAVSSAQAVVAVARDVVIRTEGAARARELTAELVQSQRRIAAIGNELRWLIGAGAVPLVEDPGFSFSKPRDAELRDALFRLDPRNIPLPGKALADMVLEPAPSKLWAEAASALEHDSSTLLPAADR